MIDPDISTLTNLPYCGHEECDTMYNPETGYVTVCEFFAPALETVSA